MSLQVSMTYRGTEVVQNKIVLVVVRQVRVSYPDKPLHYTSVLLESGGRFSPEAGQLGPCLTSSESKSGSQGIKDSLDCGRPTTILGFILKPSVQMD